MNSQRLSKTPVQNLIVASDDAERRLDNYLSSRFKQLPKTLIYRIIRTGQVRINGKRAEAGSRVHSGDIVRIPPLELASDIATAPPLGATVSFEAMVCYEDSAVIVVNKPAGLAAHGGTGIRYSLIDLARAARPRATRLDLVHRLDRATSGCLLLAKDPATLRHLNAQISAGAFSKHYQTLLRGRLQPPTCEVDIPLNSDIRTATERHTTPDSAGKAARTRFTVARQFDNCCLVDVIIDTGRTHQIRAHAGYLGHPIAGDSKYGDAAFNDYAKQLGLRRMFLHSRRIEFALTRRITVDAPLPPELAALIGRLAAGLNLRESP